MKYLLMVSSILFTNCGDDGERINTTRVKPPVQEALPIALINDSSLSLNADVDYSKTCQSDASLGDMCQKYTGVKNIQCIVKNRLFCSGPTEVLGLLSNLDGRLEEIEKRSEESDDKIDCVQKAATDLSSQISYPGDQKLASKYQCQDSSIGLAFGEAGGTWHVREASGAAAQAFSISATNVVEGYIWFPTDGTFSGSTGLLQIKSERDSGTVEITGGGVGIGFCSFHFKSNATHVYIYANPDGIGSSCDYDNNGADDAGDWVEVCLDATTLDEAPGACTALSSSLALTTLGRDTTTATGGRSDSYSAAVEPANGASIHRFEMNTYLSSLFDAAKTFDGVDEFKP